ELEHATERGSRIEVRDASADGDPSRARDDTAGFLPVPQIGVEILRGHRPMVKPVASRIDELSEYGRCTVVLPDELEAHRPAEREGDIDVDGGRIAPIHHVLDGKTRQVEERSDTELLRPAFHFTLDVLHDIRDLHYCAQQWPERKLRHEDPPESGMRVPAA